MLLDELYQEAAERASSPEGIRALVHALLMEPSVSRPQAIVLYRIALQTYVAAKRRLEYVRKSIKFRPAVPDDGTLQEIARLETFIADQKTSMAEMETILGPVQAQDLKDRVGRNIGFGFGQFSSKFAVPTKLIDLNTEPPKNPSATCKACGKGALAWEHFTFGWRLLDPTTGQFHDCSQYREYARKIGRSGRYFSQ